MSASASTLFGNGLRIFSGRANPALAQEIADELDVQLGKISIKTFSDSETHAKIDESVRGAHVFVVQPTCPPVNENLMELLIMLDAFHRASADKITAVVPYFGYARQDRKAVGREPVTARLVSDLITSAGADRVISVDLHVPQVQGFFNIPLDHLTASLVFVDRLKQKDLSDCVIVSPDVGRAKLAEKYANALNLPLVLMHKRRTDKTVEVVEIVGDVKDKIPVIIDDIIAGGSVVNEIEVLAKKGARPCYLLATHGILLKEALELLSTDLIEEVVVTNTVPVPKRKIRALPKLKVLSIAPLLAETIERIWHGKSISEIFDRMPFAV